MPFSPVGNARATPAVMQAEEVLRDVLRNFVAMDVSLHLALRQAIELLDRPCTGQTTETQICVVRLHSLLCKQNVVVHRLGMLYEDTSLLREVRSLPFRGYRDVLQRLREALVAHQRNAETLVVTELIPSMRAEVGAAGLALAMGSHPRLAAASPLLALDTDLLAHIAAAADLA